MNVNALVMRFAGGFVLGSLALAHGLGQADLTRPTWLWFTAFVGANLFQASFTRFCPLATILSKTGVPGKFGA